MALIGLIMLRLTPNTAISSRKPPIIQRVVNTMRLLLIKTLLIFCFSVLLNACSLFDSKDTKPKEDEYAGLNEADFHNQAKKALQADSYDKAVKLYETLEARYPFGDYSAQTQLDLAYAYHKNGDPEASLAAASGS